VDPRRHRVHRRAVSARVSRARRRLRLSVLRRRGGHGQRVRARARALVARLPRVAAHGRALDGDPRREQSPGSGNGRARRQAHARGTARPSRRALRIRALARARLRSPDRARRLRRARNDGAPAAPHGAPGRAPRSPARARRRPRAQRAPRANGATAARLRRLVRGGHRPRCPMTLRLRLERYRVPLAGAFHTARFAFAERRGALLTLEDDDGRRGRGEAAPLPDYSDDDLAQAEAALTELELSRVPPASDRDALGRFLDAHPVSRVPSARSALESALLELEALQRGLPVHRLLAEPEGS